MGLVDIDCFNEVAATLIFRVQDAAGNVLIFPSLHVLCDEHFWLVYSSQVLYPWLVWLESFFAVSYLQTNHIDIDIPSVLVSHLPQDEVLHQILELDVRMRPFADFLLYFEVVLILFVDGPTASYFEICFPDVFFI